MVHGDDAAGKSLVEAPVPVASARPPKQDHPDVKIAILNLSFFYGPVQALNNITLDVPARKATGLIGPSGCGKSTPLRVLNRMYDLYPTQRATGEVWFEGCNILSAETDLMALRSRIGMVAQKPSPFLTTIRENIALGVRLHEILTDAEMEERVEWALRRTALWDEVRDRLGNDAASLSGGQQQRLCIARAIAVRPEVILFDEPTSALDPISMARIEALIEELKQDLTIVIVTHNLQQAARCTDQVAMLYRGELVEAATTLQMFTAPRDCRAKDYITGRFG